jgi:hypothetical protein
MIGSGDTVRHELPIGFKQRHCQVNHDARARFDLPLEGVAMNVDDPRQDKQSCRVEHAMLRSPIERCDYALAYGDVGRCELSLDQNFPTGDAHIAHERDPLLHGKLSTCPMTSE